jgi:primosomal protein N' (replication factor Y) (superfamily II helicase)
VSLPVASVALPLPLFRSFSYRVPDELAANVAVGSRVLVPFGKKERIGWVEAVTEEGGSGKLRELVGVLDPEPSVPPELLDLCRWIGDYYLAPLGLVLRTALPAVLSGSSSDVVELVHPEREIPERLTPLERQLAEWLRARGEPQRVVTLRRELGERSWWPAIHSLVEAGVLRLITEAPRTAPAVRTRRVVRLTGELGSLLERERAFARSPRQRECWEVMESLGGSADLSHLTGQLGFSSSVVRGLVEKGYAETVDEEVSRDPYASIESAPPPALLPTPAQAAVLERLVSGARSEAPGTFLLRGVTGSGKTLVYIELLREVVERQGRTAIVLVPEIALTPQTVGRFKAVFGDRVAVLHSALSEGERYDEWRALRAGEKRIVVGARSAVFAPLPDLGAIVVDEEHEGSYKQGEAPRYHAREVAVVRARAAGAVCLLGSATPSLESWKNAQEGKYTLLELPARVAGQPLPPILTVDLRAERKRQREAVTSSTRESAGILSDVLVERVHDRLRRGEQTILLLNRRGYSAFVQCRDCGQVWHCPACNVSLTYHRRRGRLTCHYCMHEEPAPERCSACGSRDLGFRGVGTEQVERAVGEAFPAARLARMDVDTTTGKWAHHEILGRVERGEVDVLLGTQMIAKGLDFPNVTLVGVINADVGMNLPDFRATERTFQLLTQVAGRAGRGAKGGEVIVQTALPTHYAIACAAEHDFLAFAERELAERLSPSYPPHTRLLNIVISGLDEDATRSLAQTASDWLTELLARRSVTGVEIIGPAPCPIDRIRTRWRWHVLLRSDQGSTLGTVGRYLAERFRVPSGRHDLRVALDRDPVALL